MIALTIRIFPGKVISFFNILFGLVIVLLLRSRCLSISWLQSLSTVILKPKKRNSVIVSTFFPLLFAMKLWEQMRDLNFLNVVLWQFFSLSSFTLIKKLFSFSSISSIRVVSSEYLSLLILCLPILIPACVSSSPSVSMMYSAYKLNKQGDNTQLCWTHFPILNHSIVPCPVQTVASSPYIGFSGNRKCSLILPSF